MDQFSNDFGPEAAPWSCSVVQVISASIGGRKSNLQDVSCLRKEVFTEVSLSVVDLNILTNLEVLEEL